MKDLIKCKLCSADCLSYLTCKKVNKEKFGDVVDFCPNFVDRAKYAQLPCELGTTIYYVRDADFTVIPIVVDTCVINKFGVVILADVNGHTTDLPVSMLGNRLFYTEDDALNRAECLREAQFDA